MVVLICEGCLVFDIPGIERLTLGNYNRCKALKAANLGLRLQHTDNPCFGDCFVLFIHVGEMFLNRSFNYRRNGIKIYILI